MSFTKTSKRSPIRERLRTIPVEIGQAYRSKNYELHAHLIVEKAMYLELMGHSGGTGELLAQAQKDAAAALEKVENTKGALKFYKKAFSNRAKIVKYLVGKESAIKSLCGDIARLKGILASNPDKQTRARIEAELRSQKLMLPEETLRYEVNIEEVDKIIALLDRQKRNVERESEFTESQLRIVKADLEQLHAKIKHLEDMLGEGAA